jgi:hypothetical protein
MGTQKRKMTDIIGEKKLMECVEKMGYLYERWQDEREYEDFNDYVTAFERVLGQKTLKFTKSPFVVTFIMENRKFFIRVKSQEAVWGEFVKKTV